MSFIRLFYVLTLLIAMWIPSAAIAQMNEGETVTDAAVKENKAMDKIKDVPGLPRVLLIGDSISIAYTVPVRKLLDGKANVHRIPTNGGSSSGPGRAKSWVGSEKWDVIHFNFGVHDAKIKNGKPTNDLAAYEQNLRAMVAILKATGAKIIFATTTPVPAILKPDTRKFDPIPPYNEVALKVMKENNIPVDDLYTLMLPVQEKYQRPFDVHFTPEGSNFMADTIAKQIEQQLPSRSAKP
ncbi:MAG: SGNH/GDSL hydrolase family protein [Candidatus Methylacidiphilales bacterium]|nr:SGNH/GDSL hydrolase family protein [Candidatus Methylacidiphilales bacterium]